MAEDSYKTYFEQMPCYISIQDRDLRIIDANKAFTEAFGEWEGRYCYQVYKQRPESCEICPVQRTFHDGLPHHSEEKVKTLDGEEVSTLVGTKPICDEAGKIVAVMEVSTDVTEIKRLQEEYKERLERYRLLFEEVPCYISIQDRDMRIIRANRAHRETFGTAYGKKCYKVVKQRSEECTPCVVRDAFRHGHIHQREEVVTAQDGRQLYVLVTAAPIKNAQDEVIRVIEMSADITSIRELQDKLAAVGLLVGSISHDIKGSLNTLDGGMYMVNSGMAKNNTERVNQGWEMTMRSVDHIRSLVMNILYYAKDREPIVETVVGRDLLEGTCKQLEKKAEQLEVELVRDFDSTAGEMEADPRALQSLLINLLENSLDACRVDVDKESHQVTAGFRDLPEHVQFEISDNGIGMEQDTANQAFSLFYSSKGAEGTGLGLFIADKIAKAHGGKIELTSELGKGTRFVVEIPKKPTKKSPD